MTAASAHGFACATLIGEIQIGIDAAGDPRFGARPEGRRQRALHDAAGAPQLGNGVELPFQLPVFASCGVAAAL
jgi:hypothetical protein